MVKSKFESRDLSGVGVKVSNKNKRIILAAAEQEFVVNGYQGASVSRISITSGIPRTNIHYYFSSKLELYGAVLTGILGLWNSAFTDIKSDDDPREALSNYISSKIEYSKTNPDASRIFASELIHGAPYLSEYLKTDFKSWISEKAAVIQSWCDQGKIDPIDPMHLLFMIWGSTQQYANFGVEVEAALGRSMDDEDFELAKSTIMHIILKGCGL